MFPIIFEIPTTGKFFHILKDLKEDEKKEFLESIKILENTSLPEEERKTLKRIKDYLENKR